MTALIIYDSFGLASKANILLQRASANADRFLDWRIVSFRTQMLRSEPFAQAVLKEAVEANLIICAWLESRPFHHWIQTWLEQWISSRNNNDAAIAVLGERDDAAWKGLTELSRFAAMHGLALIGAGRRVVECSGPGIMSPMVA